MGSIRWKVHHTNTPRDKLQCVFKKPKIIQKPKREGDKIEGFKIIFYNEKRGYVLECGFYEEDDKDVWYKISKAIVELNKIRKAHGYEPQVTTYRNSQFYVNKHYKRRSIYVEGRV